MGYKMGAMAGNGLNYSILIRRLLTDNKHNLPKLFQGKKYCLARKSVNSIFLSIETSPGWDFHVYIYIYIADLFPK